MNCTNKNFESDFTKALDYAKKVVFRFTSDPVEMDDLLQDFSLEVLSRKDKYADIIKYKITAYKILQCKFHNSKRKKKADAFSDQYYAVDLFNFENDYHADDDHYKNYSRRLSSSLTSPSNVDQINENHEEQIESILHLLVSPNGRKNSVHSYKKQNQLIQDYNKSNLTTRQFCEKRNISTATLHNLLKNGPKKVSVPKKIEQFKMYALQGISRTDIANHFNVSRHSVSQNVSKMKKLIVKHFEVNGVCSTQQLAKFQY